MKKSLGHRKLLLGLLVVGVAMIVIGLVLALHGLP